MLKNGPPGCQCRRTRLTIRPPSKWPTEQSKLSPKAIGNGLRHNGVFGNGFVRSCAPNEQGAAESSPAGSVFRLFGLCAHNPLLPAISYTTFSHSGTMTVCL